MKSIKDNDAEVQMRKEDIIDQTTINVGHTKKVESVVTKSSISQNKPGKIQKTQR